MKKKILSALTAITLIAGTIPVFAANNTDELTKALVEVKARIDIPAECTEFTSDVRENDNTSSYTFRWESKDGTANFSVDADSSGHISSASSYVDGDYNAKDGKISQYTLDDAKNYADTYLTKAVPEAYPADAAADFIYNESDSYASLSGDYNVSYKRIKDGVEVMGDSAQFTLCIRNNELALRSMSISYNYEAKFSGTANVMDSAAAKAAYTKAFPTDLTYRKYTDYTDSQNKSQIYLVYDFSGGAIDAVSGKEFTGEKGPYSAAPTEKNSMSADAAGATSQASLSPEEEAEIEKISNLYDPAKILTTVKAMPELKLDAKSEILTKNLYKGYNDDKKYQYMMYVGVKNSSDEDAYNHDGLNIDADAETGEITGIGNTYYYPVYALDAAVTSEAAKDTSAEKKELTDAQKAAFAAKADAFITKYYKDKASASKKVDYAGERVYYGRYPHYGYGYGECAAYYRRLINNIPYENNYLSASWNTDDDKLYNFREEWDDDISSAPAADKAVSADAAYETVLAKYPLTLSYEISDDGTYTAVYTTGSYGSTVNALTGKLVGYNGEEIAGDEKIHYTDIENHWAKNIIETLATYGIYISGDKFAPDEKITLADYKDFIGKATKKYYYNDTAAESNEAADKPVTREEAIKLFLNNMGISEVAELKGIYVCNISDSADIDEEYLGYCAIAEGYGIVKGNAETTLSPKSDITRAEAAAMIYNYLTR